MSTTIITTIDTKAWQEFILWLDEYEWSIASQQGDFGELQGIFLAAMGRPAVGFEHIAEYAKDEGSLGVNREKLYNK